MSRGTGEIEVTESADLPVEGEVLGAVDTAEVLKRWPGQGRYLRIVEESGMMRWELPLGGELNGEGLTVLEIKGFGELSKQELADRVKQEAERLYGEDASRVEKLALRKLGAYFENGNGRVRRELVPTNGQGDAATGDEGHEGDRRGALEELRYKLAEVKLDARQMALPVQYMRLVNDVVIDIVGGDELPKDPIERFKLLRQLALEARDLRIEMEEGDSRISVLKAEQSIHRAVGSAVSRGSLTHHVWTNPVVRERLTDLLTLAVLKIGAEMMDDETEQRAELLVAVQKKLDEAKVERGVVGARVSRERRQLAAEGKAELGEAQGKWARNIVREVVQGVGEGVGALVHYLAGEKAEDGTLKGGLAAAFDSMSTAGGKVIGNLAGQPVSEFAKALGKYPEVPSAMIFGGGAVTAALVLGWGGWMLLPVGAMGVGLGVGVVYVARRAGWLGEAPGHEN